MPCYHVLGNPDVSKQCLTRDATIPNMAVFLSSVSLFLSSVSLLPPAAVSSHAVLLVLFLSHLLLLLDPVAIVLCLDRFFTQIKKTTKFNSLPPKTKQTKTKKHSKKPPTKPLLMKSYCGNPTPEILPLKKNWITYWK